MKSFPNYRQLGSMDCGPICLKIISSYYGKEVSVELIREKCQITKLGVSLQGITEAAEFLGYETISAKISLSQLEENKFFPCVLHWNQNHFVVLYKLTKNKAYISDPAQGKIEYSREEFCKIWKQDKEEGVALFLEPKELFFKVANSTNVELKNNWDFLFFYLKKYKKRFYKLIIGLLISSAILLISPYLTQVMVDKGIELKNLSFVYLVLLGQLLMFLGSSIVDIIRNWQLLHIGAQINISLLSDFFTKLFKLPIHFFETHLLGDLLQRANDHKHLENLLTIKSMNIVYALINLLLFSSLLVYYNIDIFLIFLFGSMLGISWVLLFMKKRAAIDFKFFELHGQHQSKVIELLSGYEEIKISNSARMKLGEWEEIQKKIYKVRISSLSLDQMQHNGFDIIMRLTSIFLTVVTAKLVIENKLSLGSMFAINMIIGQLVSPINTLVDFIPAFQDAKLALLRINEVHNQENEEAEIHTPMPKSESSSVIFKDVSFSYTGSSSNLVLKNINFEIEAGKITAIVGASGSGKTSLLKLLLKFYRPTQGKIFLGNNDIEEISSSKWRDKCGVVLQGGKIFSDTIVNNIAMGQSIDMEQIVMTSALANLDDFVNSNLPMGYLTKIGEDGLQLSEGQKQRLLLARAMYKNPDYLFLDEATSSLDAKNEREVMISLNNFCFGKTVLIVAHRLSTVRNADKIIVLNNGRIVEIGNHKQLVQKRGIYFDLIREQLELGI